MSWLIKTLMGAGGAILAVLSIFIYGKRSGKNEVENEQRNKIIDGIEKRHKIDAINRNKSDDAIVDEMYDPSAD